MSGGLPMGLSVSRIRPYDVKDGVVEVHHDKPVEKWVLRFIDRDRFGRRRTRFLGEFYGEEQAQSFEAAIASLPTPDSDRGDRG